MKKIVFHDTETTGAEGSDRIIETAHLIYNESGELLDYKEELCNPGIKINPAASVVHGYRNRDIQDKQGFNKTESSKILSEASCDKDFYYVAHNAPFDLGMLLKEGISFNSNRIIDTLKVAKKMLNQNDFPEMKSKGLQYIRYFFDDYFYEKEEIIKKDLNIDQIRPHTALSDIAILKIFLDKVKEDFNLSLDEMVEISQSPVLLENITIGKIFESGTPYKEVIVSKYKSGNYDKFGSDYLHWFISEDLAKKSCLDADIEYSMKYWMAHAILNKDIFYKPDYNIYLNFGILFFFNKEEIKSALTILNKEEDHKIGLLSSYLKQKTKEIQDLETKEEELSDLESNRLLKIKFFKNYLVEYRQSIIIDN